MFDMKTHHVKMRSGRPIVSQVTPHVRLKRGEDPPVFIQGGKFYSEDGAESHPDWLDEEVAKLTTKTKIEVGLEEAPLRRQKPAPEPEEE